MLIVYIGIIASAFLFLYWLVPAKTRAPLLIVVNFAVLLWLGWINLAMYLAALALVTIGCHRVTALDRKTRKRQRQTWLTFITLVLVLPLIYFRSDMSTHTAVARPIALSYFTLMLLGFFFDVYRGSVTPAKVSIRTIGFTSFFPLTAMGPIERDGHMSPQFREPRSWNAAQACDGVFLISLGAFKKFVVADRLSNLLTSPGGYLKFSGADLWLFCILALIQIFSDFSGWIDIARGFAKLLGFDLVDNFNQPYFARNVPDIWRRWHISLVDWLRDFVYTPIALRSKNLHLATFVVMLLVGLWHTFSLNALFWAMYWSALYSMAIVIRQRGLKIPLPTAFKVAGVFLLMSLSTVFILPKNLGEFGQLLKNLFSMSSETSEGIVNHSLLTPASLTIALAGFLAVVGLETIQRRALSKTVLIAVAIAVLLLTIILGSGTSTAFIYLRY